MQPTTRYAKSGDVHIAYRVFGEGPADLVIVPRFVSRIESCRDEPGFARRLRRLGSFSWLVMFHNGRGTAEQHIREGKYAIRSTRLSCRAFKHDAARLQLHALAYNIANFMRALALPEEVEHWSLTTLREKFAKTGASTGVRLV